MTDAGNHMIIVGGGVGGLSAAIGLACRHPGNGIGAIQ